jgi:transposase
MPMSNTSKPVPRPERIKLLRMHLIEKKPVSQICKEYDIKPNVFYSWQQKLFENGEAVFARSNKGHENRTIKSQERKIADLSNKLARKDEVISEIMESHVELKKTLGGL